MQMIVRVIIARPYVGSVISHLNNKQTRSFWCVTERFTFLKKHEVIPSW